MIKSCSAYDLKRTKEQGVVSLLTVMFFMVFISLIVMGFISIVVADQRQTTDNDLSASALAAARSGIEDGKRILLYCASHPGADCDAALSSQDNCNAFNTSPANSVATALKIDINANGEGMTGGSAASAYQQYFTCLTIQKDTQWLSAPLASGKDFIQRLDTTPASFDSLTVSWSGPGTFVSRSAGVGGWPVYDEWKDTASPFSPYIPVIRFQTIAYPSSGVLDLDAIEANSRTFFIVPCNGAATCSPVGGNSNSLDLRDAYDSSGNAGLRSTPTPTPPIIYSSPCDVTTANYTCSVSLSGYDSSGSTRYYVRASVLYASSTTLKITPSSGGAAVRFDGVQPQIDVTGRTSDVFKRVRAEVSYQPTVTLPTYALDSAAPICKKMTVIDTMGTYDCN